MSYDDNSLAQMAYAQLPGHRGTNPDDKLYVEFKLHPLKNDTKSEAAQRPIYEDVEYVQIVVPGARDIYFQPATPDDKARFSRQYAAFKAGNADAVVGTPLALLPSISPSMVEEFAYFKVKTIEALASLNDSVAGRFPGCHELKRKAQAFLDAAEAHAPVAKVQAELEQRDAQIAALQEQIKELAAAVAKSPKSSK